MMRSRFLLQVRSSGIAEDRQIDERTRLAGLAPAFQTSQLTLFASNPSDLLVLPDQRGVIAGKLFHRHGVPGQITSLSPHGAAGITATAGRQLIERYWGSYVAILLREEGVCILRDPSGMVPCYYTCRDGGF